MRKHQKIQRTVKIRRRREQKTDYKARVGMLKSGVPRLVIRKTNKYIISQIVMSRLAQDSIVFAAYSKELPAYGYQFNLKNIPASYLTGFLLGIKAKGKIKKAILDLGLQRSTKGSKIYAALKGFVDSGIEVSHKADILPSPDRINGKHTGKQINVDEIKRKIEQEGGKLKPSKAKKETSMKQKAPAAPEQQKIQTLPISKPAQIQAKPSIKPKAPAKTIKKGVEK